jgi:small subunit ribosomal protein S21
MASPRTSAATFSCSSSRRLHRNAVNWARAFTESVVHIEHTAHTHDSTPEVRRQALAEIRIFDGESIESALRRFKRQVQQEGIIKEVKKHAFFLKPGERKRLKSKLAQKLKRKKVRRSPADSDSKSPSRSQ